MRGGKAETGVRVYLDLENREGELFTLVTVPGEPSAERPVTWAGEPGRRLLVAKGTASEVLDPAGLATAVERGNALDHQLSLYGGLLFEAAFGQELWQQLIDAAIRRHEQPTRPAQGMPYLELAVRGPATTDVVGLQALRWEALHDGSRAVAVQGTMPANGGGGVSVGIVRIVPGGDLSRTTADLLIPRIPRVLFAVGSPLADPGVRPAAELMGIIHDLDRDGGSIHPKILDSATRASLREALRVFQPDVLHLIGHGGRLPDGQVAVQIQTEPGASAADRWLTAEQLLSAFGEAGHAPRLIVLSACRTASGDERVNAAPFAVRLVAGGVPIVVAMAGDIADTACRVFTRALTTALGHGVPLGKAVLRGRCAAFYQRPGFWSTDWVLPSVFLAGHLPEQARLVDPGNTGVIRDRVQKFGLAQAPVFYGRREFIDAIDRLLDGGDPLNVLLAYTPDSRGSFGGERLLRQLGARALRLGVLPLLLGPFDQSPPTTRVRLAREIKKSIQNVSVLLGLPSTPRGVRIDAAAADPDTEPFDLAIAIRADLDDLISALPADDPVWSRAAGQPRVVLLCHRVDGWLDALDDLLGMLGPTGLHPGEMPLPVVATGADSDPLKNARQRQWSGKQWVKAAPLNRFPTAEDEDLLAYQWWLLNPPDRRPVYAPKRSAPERGPHEWAELLRWIMQDCMYDEDKLYGFASRAPVFFTSEMDHDLLASFARAAP
jgi:CHAT domain